MVKKYKVDFVSALYLVLAFLIFVVFVRCIS